jgi:hypothetical protein
MNATAIYGRDAEIHEIRELLRHARSFLLHGSSGVGKTLLLRYFAAELPEMLYCSESSGSQAVFRSLATELVSKNNHSILKACGRDGLIAIREKSAVSLRGIVTDALRENSYWVVLDHVQSPSQSFSAAVKELIAATEAKLVASARSEHMEDVGFLLPIFSDRSAKYALRNFDTETAKAFAWQVANRMRLEAVNRDEAIEKIVRFSKGNPGAIVAMLQMAISPKYIAQQHVKLSPLYIDFRLSWGATHG